jgi:nicotinamide phosphoribosyltransferase
LHLIAPLREDGYKVGHPFQYVKGTTLVYSNMTARASRIPGVKSHVVYGPQFYSLGILIEEWNRSFFDLKKDVVVKAYKRRIDNYLGPGTTVDHIAALHELGYLPLHMKALPEGTLCPLRVPYMTWYNTMDDFFWVTNAIESDLSNTLWHPPTAATIALGYRQKFERYARETGSPLAFVQWQGHDFSYRGLTSLEAAALSGAGHLLSFTGTDTIPAIDLLEQYYGADSDKELVGGSVPATEHSVMSVGMKDGEYETFRRLLVDVYPKGIVSVVSDTWDLWTVLTSYLPRLREVVTGREGKLVIRPDSGDPVKIILGDPDARTEAERKGAIRLLFEVFGGSRNAAGFIEPDPHIGLIYGDSITPERQEAILSGLKAQGFSSSWVVLGIGSYTYQYLTRDTLGFAVKATYAEVNGKGQPIFKDPKTDSGIKKSAMGLLKVCESPTCFKEVGIHVHENVSWEEEEKGMLQTIFKDGEAFNFQTLSDIRRRLSPHFNS